jgi:uncharacterized membrane protein YobD (UPF0266 family)
MKKLKGCSLFVFNLHVFRVSLKVLKQKGYFYSDFFQELKFQLLKPIKRDTVK